MGFFIAEFERAAKIGKIAVYRFLISKNQSKSMKFVTSCVGHVDGMKNK